MNALVKKIIVFLFPLPFLFVGLCFFADGYTDPFYLKFTIPKQQNLIIGTSRAEQGLQPEVFERILGIKIYNYAFTVAHSPFGKVYYESILKKHNQQKGGVFILAVDPWSISSWCKDPNDLEQFRENELALGNTKNVCSNPNFEYLYKNLKGNYKDILFPPSKNIFLHQDGWCEIKGISMDSISVQKRTAEKINTYRNEHLPDTKFSQVRLDYLMKTIKYFKNYGKVYLVRLPVHRKMMEIENELMPDFDDVIKNAIDLSDDYLDLTIYNDNYQYVDGNHLYKSSGKQISEVIANWIKRCETSHETTFFEQKGY